MFFTAGKQVGGRHSADTCKHCNENAIYVFTEKELRSLSPNIHFHVSISVLYIPRGPQIFLQQKQADRFVGIYKSLTDTRMRKLGLRLRNSFSGENLFRIFGFVFLQCEELKLCNKDASPLLFVVNNLWLNHGVQHKPSQFLAPRTQPWTERPNSTSYLRQVTPCPSFRCVEIYTNINWKLLLKKLNNMCEESTPI